MRRAWPRHQQKSRPSIRRTTAGGWPSRPQRPTLAPAPGRLLTRLAGRPRSCSAPLRRRHGRGLPPAARPARLHLASRRVAATSACGSTLGLRPSPPSSDAAPCGQRGQGTREAQPRRHGPSAGSLRVPASTRAARAPPSSSCSAR